MMNKALRDHVTRTAFSLDLGKLHVYHLIAHNERKHYEPDWSWYGAQFIRANRGLEERGLVRQVKNGWELTRAGELVINLLQESGLYEEGKKRLRRVS